MDYGALIAKRDEHSELTDDEFRQWASAEQEVTREITTVTTETVMAKPIDEWGGTLSDDDLAIANREVAKLQAMRLLDAQYAAAMQKIRTAPVVPTTIKIDVA